MVRKQEVGWSAGSGMRQCPTWRSGLDDAINDNESIFVERNHALGVQLAERHLQPRSMSGDLVNAVELEIQQLPDALRAMRSTATFTTPTATFCPGPPRRWSTRGSLSEDTRTDSAASSSSGSGTTAMIHAYRSRP